VERARHVYLAIFADRSLHKSAGSTPRHTGDPASLYLRSVISSMAGVCPAVIEFTFKTTPAAAICRGLVSAALAFSNHFRRN
jgi:hypothetical protein